MILTDNETKVDLLNNEAIAATIIELLRERPNEPVTVGVHGDWGAGKSSILEMIDAGFEGKDEVLCLKFNGWRFQGFEDAKIALIEGIVTSLIAKRPAVTKATEAVKDIFRSIDLLKLAKKAGGLAWTWVTGMPSPELLQSVAGTLQSIVADPAAVVTRENVQAAVETVKSAIKVEPNTKKVPEEIAAFRKSFDSLLGAAGVKQLIVLIDDLDRCLPDTAIETLEAVRLFVFTERTAFVVAADEAMIEYAVRKHFPELPDTTGPRDYARNYLEKLIQVPFRIPALGETETRIYVTLLLVGAELGEGDAQYGALIRAARERLKRPWKSDGLDSATVTTVLGEKATKAQTALILSDQLGPILASGTQGNPRQIKRFLNTLLLRQRTANARGFGEDVKLPVLAKLMLAERFLPRLFDQLASAAAVDPNGLCLDIAALEAAETEKAGTRGDGKKTAQTPKSDAGEAATRAEAPSRTPESRVLTEWLASEPIRAWARLKPAIGGIDLRPYLFVTKDRKDYFGAASALGRLSSVVERLLGPKLTVQALGPELRQLAAPEAAQVFEALRGRIMGADAFDKEPPGIAGVEVLVKAQPSLQTDLLVLLESLPPDRCGGWPATGWHGVIKDPDAVVRFERLLNKWAESAKSVALKAAASVALKTQKGGR